MSSYLLIGGKSIANQFNFDIEKSVFKYLKMNNPKILFIPFAATDYDIAINKFYKLAEGFEIDCLLDYQDEKLIIEKFYKNDVIYFCGGNFNRLIDIVNNSLLKTIIQNSNKLFIGISAGAMLFCKAGMGDRDAFYDNFSIYNYKMVDGLGILDFTICPHYDHEGLDIYNNIAKNYNCSGIALEDDTAILISNDICPLKLDSKKSIYYFSIDNNYLMSPMYEVKK